MPIAHSKSGSQVRDALILQTAGLDLLNGRRGQPVCGIGWRLSWRELRPATKTRTITRDFSGRPQPIKLASLQRRPFGTADRPAVDARGFHGDKKMSVKPRIMRQH